MPIQIFKKVNVRMQKTLGTPVVVTAISKAAEAVVTGTHAFAAGDFVIIAAVVGMTEINDFVVRVRSVSTTVSFVAENIDSTLFTTYVSGGTATKITAFDTFDNITSLSLPDSPPTELDSTAISDTEKQVVFGLRDFPKGTFALNADPLSATSLNLAAAEDANVRRAFVITMISGYVGIFYAFVSGGAGLDGSGGGIATANVSLTLRKKTQWFAS